LLNLHTVPPKQKRQYHHTELARHRPITLTSTVTKTRQTYKQQPQVVPRNLYDIPSSVMFSATLF